MKDKDRLVGMGLGILIFGLTSYLFFELKIVSLVLGLLGGYFYSPTYKAKKLEARKKKSTLEFREFIDLLNNSIGAGENLENAIRNSHRDLLDMFSDKDPIVIYSKDMVSSLDLGQSMKKVLEDFGEKMELEDVDIFIGTLIIAIDSGMNISYIIDNSKTILNQKIDIELEIDSMMKASKRELTIMTVLPLLIILLLKITRPEYQLAKADYLVRLPVFFIFVLAYRMGQKIVSLEL